MKKTVCAILAFVLILSMALPAFAANETRISVKASKTEVTVDDEIEITVAFDKKAKNISVLELIVPIDSDAFKYVEGSVKEELPSVSNMLIGDASYRERSSDLFCNWVDISATIPDSAKTIFTFKLKVTEHAKNGEYTFKLSDDCFLTDADDKDIFFDSESCVVKVNGSPETVVESKAPNAQITPEGAVNGGDVLQNNGTVEAEIVEKENDALTWIIIGAVILVAAAIVIVFSKKGKK